MADYTQKTRNTALSEPARQKARSGSGDPVNGPGTSGVDPVHSLDYLFDLLCGARRLARDHRFDFIAYLIEMSIIEVDNERKKGL